MFTIGYDVNLTVTPLKSQHCGIQCQMEGGKIRYMKIQSEETDHLLESAFIVVGLFIHEAFNFFL